MLDRSAHLNEDISCFAKSGYKVTTVVHREETVAALHVNALISAQDVMVRLYSLETRRLDGHTPCLREGRVSSGGRRVRLLLQTQVAVDADRHTARADIHFITVTSTLSRTATSTGVVLQASDAAET